MEGWAALVEASAFGAWARGSANAYPLANLVHLLGLVLLVGGIGIADLRVVGLFRTLPLAATLRALTPVALLGLLLMALSGPVLFAADAAALVASTMFRLKLVLIALALANALLFRLVWQRRITSWGEAAPAIARFSALASVALWLAVATAGRLIAYS